MAQKMTRITVSDSIDVDIDVYIDDILEFIEMCNDEEMDQIIGVIMDRNLNSGAQKLVPKIVTLYDEMKMGVLLNAMKKYSLEELEEKLNVNWIQ